MIHAKVLRALARLLDYPSEETRKHLLEIQAAFQSLPWLQATTKQGLDQLIASLQHEDIYDLQAAYVSCFDQSKAASLYLFEHVHGDSRERGQAMVDLIATYQQGGMMLQQQNIPPDYLPIFLEFASTLPEDQSQTFLSEIIRILHNIYEALTQKKSTYNVIMAAVLEFLGETTKPQREPKTMEEPISATWEEKPAFGGSH